MDYNGSVIKRIALFLIAVGAIVAMVACQGAVGKTGETGAKGEPGDPAPPAPPVNLAPIPTVPFDPVMLMDEGEPKDIDVAPHFHDPEEEDLTFEASAAPEGFITVAREGSVLTVTPVAAGEAEITVTATDPKGGVGKARIEVTVSSEDIMYVGTLDKSVALTPGKRHIISGAHIEMSFEEDEGETLTFSVSSSDESVALAVKDADNTVKITALDAVGRSAEVTITAMDDEGQTAPFVITVTVVASLAPQRSDMTADPVTLTVGDDPHVIPDVSMYFSDPAGGDLMYTAMSSDDTTANAVADGSMVTITPVAAGTATVTVTATNTNSDREAVLTITVTVESAPVVVPPVSAPTNPIPIPPKKVVLGEPTTIDISGYFTGATRYEASSVDPITVMATATNAGMLTLTPRAHGTAEVRVTAINTAGRVSDDFDVTVQAKPTFKMSKSLPHLRIHDDNFSNTPVPHQLSDLSTLFEDPDGDDASLTFNTKTNDVKKVFVVKRTYDTASPLVDNTVPPATEDARDKALDASGEVVNLYARAAGTATITVTVTDSDGLSISETFVVTVIGTASNSGPEAVNATATGTDDGAITSYTGDTRLKLSDASKKAIDNKAINDYFRDDDLGGTPGDMLTFTVGYSTGSEPTPAQVGGVGPVKVTVADADKVAPADRVANVVVRPDTWDGDPHGGEDKFTVTVTPEKAGGPQRILIIATDIAGAQHVRSFTVKVNNAPKPEGAQETPLKLSSFKGAEGLKSTSASVPVPIVAPGGGYFTDADRTADSTSSDTLECSFRPSVTGDTAPVTLEWDTVTGNDADNNTESVTLTVDPKDTFDASFVPMTVSVWCSDGLEETAEQTFTVSVTAQASIQ